MVTQVEKKNYSAEEYLELELESEVRSEYRNGEIISMTGGTPNHNDIAGNLYVLLSLTENCSEGKELPSFLCRSASLDSKR